MADAFKALAFPQFFRREAGPKDVPACFAHRRILPNDLIILICRIARSIAVKSKLFEMADETRQMRQARRKEHIVHVALEHAAALAVARVNKITCESLERLAKSPNLDDCLGDILAVCAKEFGAVGASAWLLDPASGKYRLQANIEDGFDQSKAEALHPGLMGAGPMVPMRAAYRKGTIYVYGELDFAKNISFRPYQEYLLQRKVKTVMALPLVFGERLTGLLALRFSTERILGHEENQLLQTLANQAVLAIEMTRSAKIAQATAVSNERHRFARDIHDGIAQAFLGIAMQLENVNADGETAKALQRVIDTAYQGLREARGAVEALRPKGLSIQPFPKAVQRLLQERLSHSHLSLKFEVAGDWVALNANTEEHLFRITQEAINNVLKHSNANSVAIEISSTPNEASILIADDGIGFPSGKQKPLRQGFGLESMNQRAVLAGANLSIVSGPKAGTQVFVSVERPPT